MVIYQVWGYTTFLWGREVSIFLSGKREDTDATHTNKHTLHAFSSLNCRPQIRYTTDVSMMPIWTELLSAFVSSNGRKCWNATLTFSFKKAKHLMSPSFAFPTGNISPKNLIGNNKWKEKIGKGGGGAVNGSFHPKNKEASLSKDRQIEQMKKEKRLLCLSNSNCWFQNNTLHQQWPSGITCSRNVILH